MTVAIYLSIDMREFVNCLNTFLICHTNKRKYRSFVYLSMINMCLYIVFIVMVIPVIGDISMTHQTCLIKKRQKKHSLCHKYLLVMIKFQWYVFVWRCKVIAINNTVHRGKIHFVTLKHIRFFFVQLKIVALSNKVG